MANALENLIVKHLKPFFLEASPGSAYASGAKPPSVRRLEETLKTHRFADLLPLEAYDPDTGLFINADSYGFAIEISTAVGLDANTLSILSGLFVDDDNEEGMVLQHCLYASPDVLPFMTRWANTMVTDPEDDEKPGDRKRNNNLFRSMARNYTEHLLSGVWQSIYPNNSIMVRDFRAFITLQKPLPAGGAPKLTELMKKRMSSHRERMLSTLKTAGLQGRPMDADDLVDLLDTMINAKTVKRERKRYDEEQLIRDQVVARDNMLLVGRDDLFMNNPDRSTDLSIFGVESYPDQWPGWANGELIGSLFEETRRISCPFMITMTIHYLNQLDQASVAQMKFNRAVQMSESPIGKTVTSWQDKRREWEFVTRKISEGHTNVKVNYQVVLFSSTEHKEKNERELYNTFKANQWTLYKQRFCLLPAFMLSLPMCASQVYVDFAEKKKLLRTMPSFTAVNLAPWIAEWKGNPTPLQLLTADRGQVSNFNPWDNKEGNFNVAVAARPGSGKSFFMQDFLLAVLGQGGRAWVFDRGRSFEKLVRFLSGYYSTQFLVFDGSERISLNPFTHVRSWEGSKDEGSERIMIHNLLMQMAVRGDETLPAERQTWLDVALQEAWKRKGCEAEITDVRDILRENEDTRYHDLADALHPFCRDGVFGHYFSGPSTIDLSDDFVVVEMRELDETPQLQTIVLLLMMMKVSQTMYSPRRTGRKQVCLIDEAWKMLSHGNAASFIEEGYRTARKYGGSFVSISQGINDFYKNPTTRACLESSDWTLLLAQKKESIDQLAKTDRLPGGKDAIKLIRNLKTVRGYYSECAIIGPNGIATARLVPDKFKEMLLTTNDADVAEHQALMDQGLDLVEALEVQAQRRKEQML